MPELLRDDLDACMARTRGLWDELRDRRIFITGATGFFGCWLLESLLWANRHLQLNVQVTILTRNPATLQRKAPHFAADPALQILTGDVRSFRFPGGAFSHIIHAATDSSVELNTQQPTLMFDTIVEGTRRCLEFAQQAQTRKFLFLSSGAVYGMQPPDVSHVQETSMNGPDPLDPANAYAEGKRAAELLCAIAARGTGLEPKIARCFAFVGPYMKLEAHFAIGNFILDQMNRRPIRITGDGTPLRSYMYAADLMIWLWTILFRGTSMRAYNVGSEQAVSIRELASAVAEALSPRVGVEILGTPGTAPPLRYVPSTARAQAELGLSCEVSLHDAIRRTQQWFLQSQATTENAR